jgi:hypothetical protein
LVATIARQFLRISNRSLRASASASARPRRVISFLLSPWRTPISVKKLLFRLTLDWCTASSLPTSPVLAASSRVP